MRPDPIRVTYSDGTPIRVVKSSRVKVETGANPKVWDCSCEPDGTGCACLRKTPGVPTVKQAQENVAHLAALVLERQSQGGFWKVDAPLQRPVYREDPAARQEYIRGALETLRRPVQMGDVPEPGAVEVEKARRKLEALEAQLKEMSK